MKIAIIGTRYVGLVTASCLAETGNEVIAIDKDGAKNPRHKKHRSGRHKPARSASSTKWQACANEWEVKSPKSAGASAMTTGSGFSSSFRVRGLGELSSQRPSHTFSHGPPVEGASASDGRRGPGQRSPKTSFVSKDPGPLPAGFKGNHSGYLGVGI